MENRLKRRTMPKILLAPDSFKGSLSAIEFCEIAAKVLRDLAPDAQVFSRPMSDGGEGFVDSFVSAGLAEKHTAWVANPLGRKTKAAFGWQPDSRTAIIEMAQASGLTKLRADERNPPQTHSYGTGQLILEALKFKPQKIIIGLGGSATNDGGAGALQALGVPLLDAKGQPINLGGQSLKELAHIGDIPPKLRAIEWQLACDVTNPLLGENGATAVFGPQKGVNEHNYSLLESGLENLANHIQQATSQDIRSIPGAGAAGGMAGGFMGLLNARITPGFEVLAAGLQLEQLLITEKPNWILTGEGRMDTQTRFGKLPMRIAQLGQAHGIPTVGVCGALACSPAELPEFTGLFSIVNAPMHEIDALQHAPTLLYDTLYSVFKLLLR